MLDSAAPAASLACMPITPAAAGCTTPGMADDLPPAFDPAIYRVLNPTLALPSDAAAEAHYRREGRDAGLIASPLALRENVLALVAAGAGEVLEIGPFCSPLLRGPRVRYLDMLDAAGLRARAAEIGLDPLGCPERIDYVGDLAQVDRRFAAVVSSNAIEHQPDLVRHLREVERILEPNGACVLIVPDKRYCFDHFLPESSIADVLQAHRAGRRRHQLDSVIEHMALTTHNDCRRHWAGDHDDPTRGRIERVQAAIERFDAAGLGYVDVHAWQFTPASFRAVIDQLGALGLIGLEVADVYDTPRDRHEFCAVLRLSPAARAVKQAQGAGVEVIALQTADPFRYAPMLAVTQANVTAYCRRRGFAYEAFVGICRGVHAWQASYNRIPLMQAMIDRGYRGWVLYLDADAYVADLDFDLTAYLAGHADRAAIIANSGVTDARWDVNDGIMLVNLGHPQGRRLIEQWSAKFARLDDAMLHAAEHWIDDDNDQDLLHQLLREDAAIADAVLVEARGLLNSPDAQFVRQHLRSHTPDLAERIEAIAAEIEALDPAVVDRRRSGPPTAHRRAARLAHPVGCVPALVEADIPAPLPAALVDEILTAWRQRDGASFTPRPYMNAMQALLAAGDGDALAAMFAGMGRQALAQGTLGGARQHERARDPDFAYQLASSTYDRLVSLAEAIGALDVENPEMGPWGINSQRDPRALFESVERALDADLKPPPTIGGYLGIAVGGGRVMHPRMIDAVHAAWRLREVGAQHGLDCIAEIGGGAGLVAYYARALGLHAYNMVGPPASAAVQAAVVGDARLSVATLPADGPYLLFDQDSLPEMARAEAVALIGDARERGARLLLSINPDGREGSGGAVHTPVRDLVAAAGGWRLAGRHRHWLRAGHVEELWLAG